MSVRLPNGLAAALLVVAPLAQATEFAGTLKDLDMDTPGGAGGAPAGMAFIVPPGTTSSATFGDLGDGATGVHFEVRQAGDALVCTQPVPLGPQAYVKARVRVPDITPGNGGWMGLNFELRARDGSGALISPPGGQYVLIRNLREPTGWQDLDQKLTVPAGATQGEFCFRFVLSTGAMDLDKLSIVSRTGDSAGPAPAPPPAAAPAAPPPVVAAPPPPVVAPAPAPEPAPTKGKDKGKKADPPVVTAAPTLAAPVVATPPGGTADSAASRGFSLRMDQRASSVACSRWIPSQPSLTVFGSADVTAVNPDAADWSGLAIEAYARDAADKPLAPGGVPYAPLFVTTQTGVGQKFSVAWAPPAGASRVRLCARLSDAAGSTVFDWK